MRRRFLLMAACMAVLYAIADDRTLVKGEYWFDDQIGNRISVSIGSVGQMDFTANAAQLSEGVHRLNYRALDSEGCYSALHTWLFFRYVPQQMGAVNLEYWIDEGAHKQLTITDSITLFQVDASACDEGLHRLSYRLNAGSSSSGTVNTWMFFRYVPKQAGTTSLEYWIDEGTHRTQPISGEITTLQVDASACEEGLHRLNYRAKNSGGNSSPISTWVFFRHVPKQQMKDLVLHYWIDNGQRQTHSINGNELSFMADASSLAEGLHTIGYQVVSGDGASSASQSWTFYKVGYKPRATSLGWYRVWWNDHKDKAIEVKLPSGTTEYLFEETLAVPEYARNDDWSRNCTATFNLVFADDQGQLSPVESAVVAYPDIYPPRTTLTASLVGDSITLKWTTNEDNIRDYNVYYAENGEPYVLWKPNTVSTETVFCGRKGNTYRFLVTARDTKGNYEAMEESKAVKIVYP